MWEGGYDCSQADRIATLEEENSQLFNEKRRLGRQLQDLNDRFDDEVRIRTAAAINKERAAIQEKAEQAMREKLETEIRPKVEKDVRQIIETEIRPALEAKIKKELKNVLLGYLG